MSAADLPGGINRVEVRALQAPLEGSANDDDKNDFYLNLFQSTNVSVAGPYVKKFSIIKDGHKGYFAICQNFISDDAINRAKDRVYSPLEAANYCGKLQRFTYETYVNIFEKNMRIFQK